MKHVRTHAKALQRGRPSHRHIGAPPRPSAIAALVAGLVLIGATGAHAQEGNPLEALKAELARTQAENARLRQALEDTRKASPPVAAASATEPAQDATAAAAPASGASAPALAAVTVRSRNRLASLQDVPTSASVISGDELQRLGATAMRDITARAANVTRQNSSNARSSDLAIRGIGRKGNSEAQDPNVGITVDGVSYGYAGLSAWDFVDVDSVQVLRGPVGTLGGKNANVGGLYITTRKPSFTPSADVSITVGSRDGLLASAAIGGPVIDDLLAWRGTFYIDKVEGAFSNTYNAGDDTYTDRNKLSAKLQFLLTPSPDFSALFSYDKEPRTFENDNGLNLFHAPPATYSDGVAVNLATDPGHLLQRRWFGQLASYSYNDNYLNYASGRQDNDEQRALITGTQGGSVDLAWQLGDYRLRSITAFRNLYFDARNDEGTVFDISTQGGGGIRYAQWSQELRLNSPIGGPLDYQVGLYAIRNHHDVDSKVGFGGDAGAWFASDRQYAALDATGAGRNLLANSLNYVRTIGTADNRNFSPAVYGQFNWHLSDPLTLTAGARVTHEHRTASNFNKITDPGYGQTLDFATDANGQLATTNSAAQLADADAAAAEYFGAASYASLTPAQQQQLGYATALRKAKLGKLYSTVAATPISDTQANFNLSPTWRFSDQVTGYVSFQHGEKAGVAQVVNGDSLNARPEATNNFEIGLKNALFDKTLTLDADLFLANIRNYQLQAYVLDPVATALLPPGSAPVYIAATGNAAKVQAKGLEVDATYTGLRGTTLRFSGAYNISRFISFPNSSLPAEADPSSTVKSQDLSGRTLPGAAKFTGNLGFEHRIPVLGNRELHFDGNYAYTSRYNSDVTLSQYGWIKAYGVTDLGIGLGRLDRTWDVSLLVKNAFDTQAKAWGFTSGTLDTTPRWVAVNVSARI